jgi:hypothetical protein
MTFCRDEAYDPGVNAPSSQMHRLCRPLLALIPLLAERIATTPGDCEAREGAKEERTSAIQQKRQPPKIIIEAQIAEGDTERPSHRRRRIDCGGTRHIDPSEKQSNGGRRDGACHYRSYMKTHGIHSFQGLGHRFHLERKSGEKPLPLVSPHH